MIPKVCTSCGQSTTDPRIWAVAAWMDAERGRHAYKHNLCMTCVATRIAPLYTECLNPVLMCPACHISTVDDYDAVYGEFIPKHVGKMKWEAPFCNACAAIFRIWWMQGATELESDTSSVGGQSQAPHYTASETLAALGLPDAGA